jgi:hypothetical protein
LASATRIKGVRARRRCNTIKSRFPAGFNAVAHEISWTSDIHFRHLLARRTPYSAGKVSGVILWHMKIKQKMELSFGDLIKAAYQVWGSGRAEKMLRLAINTRLVIFREDPHFLISSANEKSVLSNN